MTNPETGYEKLIVRLSRSSANFSQPGGWLHAKGRSVCAT